MKITILQVAEKAGVSKATVSAILNELPGFREATRCRVLAAATALHYAPHQAARRMRSAGVTPRSQSMTIGFLITQSLGPDPDFSNAFHYVVLQGVQRAAKLARYHVLVASEMPTADEQLRYVQSLRNGGVDGWILADWVHPEVADFMREHHLPAVAAGDASFPEGFSCVCCDNTGAMELAVRHLIELGHRRIGFVGWQSAVAFYQLREGGFVAALHQAGLALDETLICRPEGDWEQVRIFLRQILESTQPATALVIPSDILACWVTRDLRALGRRVPEDLSVVGFDDMWYARANEPALTTLRNPALEIGQMAFSKLLEQIACPETAPARTLLPVELVVRASTAAVNVTTQVI